MNKGWNKMTEDEVLAEFRASNALLEGHFLLFRAPQRSLSAMRPRADEPDARQRLAMAIAQKIPATSARKSTASSARRWAA
jgi:orotate phosphoribosyltransferase